MGKSAQLFKPSPVDPKLEQLLELNKKIWDSMSPEERKSLLSEQAESWSRQDKD